MPLARARVPTRPSGYSHSTTAEMGLLRKWVDEGKTATTIAGLLGRDLSSVARQIKKVGSRAVVRGAGRPTALSEAMEKKVVATTESLV